MLISQTARGVSALIATVVLWSSFALTIRGIDSSSLTPADVALLRFGIPLVLLAPWIPRAWRQLRSEAMLPLLLLAMGGLPHFLLSSWGGQLTSAAMVGILLPGTAPLFVALILWAWKRQRLSAPRRASLAVIVVGVGVTAALTSSATMSGGIVILLCGGCAWAVYSIGLGATQLNVTSVALVVCAPAATTAMVAAATGLMPTHLLAGTARWTDVALFAVMQGIGTGILSTIAYAYAVRTLGGARAATWGAVSPVLTAVVAIPLFGEGITAAVAAALVLIVGGVVAYNKFPIARDHRRVTRQPALPAITARIRAPHLLVTYDEGPSVDCGRS